MNKLLTKLLRMYGQPSSPDPKLMLEELEKSMSGYTDLELTEAMSFLLPKTNGFFPDPEKIFEACRQARASLAKPSPAPVYSGDDEWSNAAKSRANEIIKTELGRKAADEGWIGYLWDFGRKHRRPPDPTEQMRLIRAAKRFDETIENGKQLEGSWARIGKRFSDGAMIRRKRLSDIAYGR